MPETLRGKNAAMPGSAFTSSLVGNSLAFSFNGWAGVSSTASGTYLTTNILLGYAGNKIGAGVVSLVGSNLNAGTFLNNYSGNIIGNYLSGGGQWINELSNK